MASSRSIANLLGNLANGVGSALNLYAEDIGHEQEAEIRLKEARAEKLYGIFKDPKVQYMIAEIIKKSFDSGKQKIYKSSSNEDEVLVSLFKDIMGDSWTENMENKIRRVLNS